MDDRPLLPPLKTIHERLTKNQRERHVLRTLLRLALRDADDEPRQDAHERRQSQDRQGVVR